MHGSDDHKKSIEGLLWFELASFTLTWPFVSVRDEQMLCVFDSHTRLYHYLTVNSPFSDTFIFERFQSVPCFLSTVSIPEADHIRHLMLAARRWAWRQCPRMADVSTCPDRGSQAWLTFITSITSFTLIFLNRKLMQNRYQRYTSTL